VSEERRACRAEPHGFAIGAVMLSRRSWSRFEIAAINEAAEMLTATDGRAIAFADAQTWQNGGHRREEGREWARTLIGRQDEPACIIHDRPSDEAEAWSDRLVHDYGFVIEGSAPGIRRYVNKASGQRASLHEIDAPQFTTPTAVAPSEI
jgi:hypothetical protein